MKKIVVLFPPRDKRSDGYYFRVEQEIKILSRNYELEIIELEPKADGLRKFINSLQILPVLVKAIKNSDIVLLYPSWMWYLTAPLTKVFDNKLVLDHFTTNLYNFEFSNFSGKFIVKFIDGLVYKLFDVVITHTESMKKLLAQTYKIAKDKITVSNSCVDERIFKQEAKNKNLLKELGLPVDKKIIIYSGLFHPVHGVDTILDTTRSLTKRDDLFFIILGRKLNNEPKNVFSLNSVPYGQFPKYLSVGDLWVGTVGSGIQGERALSSNMISAMAMGLVVIVGDWDENKVIIHDGLNGFLVKRNDATVLSSKIVSVLKNRNLKKIKQNARKTAIENFSIKVMEQKFTTLFNKL